MFTMKWILIALSLVALSLFLAGCTITGSATLECAARDGFDKEACIADLALENQDIKLCDQIEDPKTIDFCKTKVAEAVGDLTICEDQINDNYWIQICNKNVAIKTNNPEPCYGLESNLDHDECFEEIANYTAQPKLCVEMKDDIKSADCVSDLALEAEDVTICNLINVKIEREICYAKLAKATQDPSKCEVITFSPLKKQCLERTQEAS